MTTYIYDTEGDGLVASKFHVLSYQDVNTNEVISITSHKDIKKWLLQSNLTLISHNHIRWDIPNLERVLNIKIKAKLIDTLALSWYLFDSRTTHNLEDWGEELGIEKPEIKDWENLSLDEYVHRCEEDVKITKLLWDKCRNYLAAIYNVKEDEVINLPIIQYLSFKLDCAKEQERSKWKLDEDKCNNTLSMLEALKEEKVELLKTIMPMVPVYRDVNPPAKPFKKDGSLSATGVKWRKLISEKGLTSDHSLPISILVGESPPNPNSPIQIKDWLFSLGWEPQTFVYKREDDGSLRPIPQIKKLMEPEFCSSVKELYSKEPGLEHLEGLSIINHRIAFLKALLSSSKDGFVEATISGLTNTLRFKHSKPCANIPGVDKPYGKEIRECLIARDGYELVGSDLTALEDLTKRHYIYPYDPDYVEAMSVPGFDPHLDLAERSGVLSTQDVEDHKSGVKNFREIRQQYKKTNYSGTYGIGAAKLARELKIKDNLAKKLLSDFWDRNWAIKRVAEDFITKIVNGQMWVFNPVSGFWYSLREVKDKFSTVNQSTGVYCFDKWLSYIRKERPQLTAQFHDEGVWEVRKGHTDKMRKLAQDSMDKVNKELNLNVTLTINTQVGDNYSDIH